MYTVVIFRFITLAVLCLAPVVLAGAICQEYPDGDDTLRLAGNGHSFCFIATIPAGVATKFTAPQPVDLALDVQANGIRLHIDSFEIGPETVSLAGAGTYQIRISSHNRLPHTLLLSRNSISLLEFAKFRQAETVATEVKQKYTETGLRASLNAWQNLGDRSAVARTYLEFGEYWDQGQEYSAAREAFDRAGDLCGEMDDLRCKTEALNNSGLESERMADFESARSNLEEAARGWRTLGLPKLEAITLSNLGLLYGTVQEYRQALSFNQRAAEVFEGLDQAAFARVLIDLGVCYRNLAEYGKAKELFERALKVEVSPGRRNGDSLPAEINLGRTLLAMGHFSAAVSQLSQARLRAEKQANRAALANASTNLGQAYLGQGFTFKAKGFLEDALLLHQALRDRRFTAADQHLLGLVALNENRSSDAKSWFLQAASLRKSTGLRLEASESLYELARLELRDGHRIEANELARNALELHEEVRSDISSPALRASFSSARRKIFDLLIEIEASGAGPDSVANSFLVAEQGQGRAILDILAEGKLLRTQPRELETKKTSIDRRLSMLSSQMLNASDSRLQTLRSEASMLTLQSENIEAQIRQSQPERAFGRPLGSVADLQRETLPAGTGLLEFHLGEQNGYVWLVTGNSLEIFSLPPRAQIERYSADYISLLARVFDRKRSPDLQKRFTTSTRRLAAALLSGFQGKPLPETLLLVCDGVLNHVPFEALTIPGSSREIGLEHNLVRVPSAGYLQAVHAARAISTFPKSFLGIVDPVFSKTDPRLGTFAAGKAATTELPRLPFTSEIDVVSRLVSPSSRDTLRGWNATRSRLESLDLASYRIVHFSTHAMADDVAPELSRLALSLVDRRGRTIDGYLEPAQIAAWRLAGSTVVLSACDTALGKQLWGEGLWGLTAALFQAGAGQMILTLASVDAEGSSEFFSQVYRQIFGRKPASTERSITEARRAMARSERWSDPYYWATYILVGRPADLYNRKNP